MISFCLEEEESVPPLVMAKSSSIKPLYWIFKLLVLVTSMGSVPLISLSFIAYNKSYKAVDTTK